VTGVQTCALPISKKQWKSSVSENNYLRTETALYTSLSLVNYIIHNHFIVRPSLANHGIKTLYHDYKVKSWYKVFIP
jgi:hypothetical protein